MPQFITPRSVALPPAPPRRGWRGRALTAVAVGVLAASLLLPATANAAPSTTGHADTSAAGGSGGKTDRHGGRTFAVLAEGLTGNKALGLARDGSLLLGGGNPDGTGVLQKYSRRGKAAGSVTTLADLPAQPTDVGSAGKKAAWVLFGASAPPEEGQPPSTAEPANRLYRWSPRGGLEEVADLGAYAAAHPDPADLEDNPGESNAYGLQPLSDGSVLVADAAANALVRVWPNGHTVTVARFPVQTLSTAHIPDPNLPPELPAEAVPTTVTVGPDGYWYVGELKGFPFTPDTSKIWRIAPDSQDVTCDAATPSHACSVHQDGLTAIIDMTYDPRGRLSVLELAEDGLAVLEGGDPSAPPPPGALVQFDRDGGRTELADGRIVLPGGIAPDLWGCALFVTDHQLVPGGGRLLRIAG